jgi:4-hydroxy-tetrahydrodipicolinate reductase
MSIRLVIAGCGGRMGQALVRLLPQFPAMKLTAAVGSERQAAAHLDSGLQAGAAANGVLIGADLPGALAHADVLIDFSRAEAAAENLRQAVAANVPILLGTTGLDGAAEEQLTAASQRIAVLQAANTSIGVTLLADLVRRAASALGEEFNIEVIEAHHALKRDAPSGTALMLAAAAAAGRNSTLQATRPAAARGSGGARTAAEIGIAVVRGGDVVGDHEIHFLGPGERLVLRHSATDRTLFARGALRAAAWLVGRPAGRYQMADVFIK